MARVLEIMHYQGITRYFFFAFLYRLDKENELSALIYLLFSLTHTSKGKEGRWTKKRGLTLSIDWLMAFDKKLITAGT